MYDILTNTRTDLVTSLFLELLIAANYFLFIKFDMYHCLITVNNVVTPTYQGCQYRFGGVYNNI